MIYIMYMQSIEMCETINVGGGPQIQPWMLKAAYHKRANHKLQNRYRDDFSQIYNINIIYIYIYHVHIMFIIVHPFST